MLGLSGDSAALLALALAWAAGVATAVAVTGFAILGGLGDVPGARSSHGRTTPTAGGLGILAGLAATLLAASGFLGRAPDLAAVVALGLGAGCLGLTDDLLGMRARTKLAALAVLAVGAVWALGPVTRLPTLLWGTVELPVWLAWAGTLLWFGVVVNTVNFMDGINGLLAATMNAAVVAFAAVAVSSGSADSFWLAAGLSAGLVGFLPYNFRARARVFAGDTGALTVGFLFACLPLLSVPREPLALVPVLLILPLLADVIVTVVVRARRGERLGHAHRSHLYQALADRVGHPRASSVFTAGVFACVGLALVLLRQDAVTVEAIVAAGVVAAALVAWGRLRLGPRLQERRATT